LQQLPYFTAPKLLLVLGLGPLQDPMLALSCTAVVSAALASIVYLLCRDNFGRGTALAVSALLLLDPNKAALTLKSSADLYLAFLLFLAILLAERERPIGAGVALLLSALIKPVTLPCALYVLVRAPRTPRRWIAAALPGLAVPLLLLGNRVWLGGAFGGTHYFTEFATMGGNAAAGPLGVAVFALWSQLVQARFLATASFAVLGAVLWTADDRRRLQRPLLVIPALFLLGYVLLAVVAPFPPYFRDFFPLELVVLPFAVFSAIEAGRRLVPSGGRLSAVPAAVVLVLLADGLIGRALDYHRDFARPLEQSMQVAAAAGETLQARRQPGDVVLAPLGLLPFVAWTLPDAVREQHVLVAERVARDGTAMQPAWIIDVPGMYTSDRARERVRALAGSGQYEFVIGNAHAALLVEREAVARP
jgi:hypothetical protein